MFNSKFLICAALALTASSLAACSDGGGTSVSNGTGTGTGTDPNKNPSTNNGTSPTNPGTGVTPPAGFKLTCEASIKAVKMDYTVTGDSLNITVAGQSGTLERIATGASGRPIYGSWDLPMGPMTNPDFVRTHQLTVKATLVIEEGRVSTVTECGSKYAKLRASTSTPATITDTTLEMLEAHSESREWTASGGDKIVGTQSFGLDLGGPVDTSAPTVTLGATFPWL